MSSGNLDEAPMNSPG